MEITKETSEVSELRHDQIDATTMPFPVCHERKLYRGILIYSFRSNTQTCFVGNKNVTPETGFPIPPGFSLQVGVDSASELYVVSASGVQRLAWISL